MRLLTAAAAAIFAFSVAGTASADSSAANEPSASSGHLVVTASSHSTLRPGTRRVGHIVVSPGYRPAWTDGRVNPHRGPQTATGDAMMRRVWTDTVPRQAVEPANR